MRYSKYFIPTLKEEPKEAEAISHNLMLRSGLIRRFTSGVYSYLPLGWRVLNKIENIIRAEMNKAGALEVLLPALHPSEIWEKSGRNKTLKEVLFSFKSQRGKNFVLGPTHEEVITDLVANNVKSYKQLPLILYQIQTKFRDEPRPRSGVLRSIEFIMKDAYSFDKDKKALEKSYNKMYDAYCSIFRRCGLEYKIVQADPGAMGGDVSHEFMVFSNTGEDKVVICDNCGYAASLEVAECVKSEDRKPRTNPAGATGQAEDPEKKSEISNEADRKQKDLKEIDTPGKSSVKEVSGFLKVEPEDLVKTIIYNIDNNEKVAVLIRGDCNISEVKLKKALRCNELLLADDEQIQKVTKGPVGFSGPVGLKNIKIVADYSLSDIKNFVTGANKKDKHFINVNIDRDFKVDKYCDIREINSNDVCPKCKSKIKIKNAIEIGHIFKLGTKYSNSFKANFLDKDMKQKPVIMGCYGIGVSRIIAAAIETNHDENGIIWPVNIAPFSVIILPLTGTDNHVKKVSEEIYNLFIDKKIEVLIDDRDERAGVKFNDADLLGIPYRVIVGEKSLSENKVELQNRKTKDSKFLPIEKIVEEVFDMIENR